MLNRFPIVLLVGLLATDCGGTESQPSEGADASQDVETVSLPPQTCTPEALPQALAPAAESGMIWARTRVTPSSVKPGEVVTVQVTLAAVDDPAVAVRLAGGKAVSIPVDLAGDQLTGCLQVYAPATVGDHAVEIEGTTAMGPVAGGTVVHVTEQNACPDGETWEAGACQPRKDGHVLNIEGMFLLPPLPTSGNTVVMVHPRMTWRYGKFLVGCHTHRLMVTEADSLWKPGDHGTPNVAENDLQEAGVLACEDMLIDEDRQIGIVASRGDAGWGGAITTWQLPPPDAQDVQPLKSLDGVYDVGGMEGLYQDGAVVYTVRKPNRVIALEIGGLGELTEVAFFDVPKMESGRGVIGSGNHLYVTDAGAFAHDHEDEEATHIHGGGKLYILDVTDLGNITVIGQAETQGPATRMAVLPNDVIAVAIGAAGVELIDVSYPSYPVSLLVVDTPGSVNALAYEAGYLLVTDWGGLRLYDASERGILRLLDSTDLSETKIFGGGPKRSGLRAVNGITVSGGQFVMTEFDAMFTGTIEAGMSGPRLLMHDKRITIPGSTGGGTYGVRFSNGGREAVWVAPQKSEHIQPEDSVVAIEPGETAVIGVTVTSPADGKGPENVSFVTNDGPREIGIRWVEGSYKVGDQAPTFQLPVTAGCSGGDCPLDLGCFDSAATVAAGRPIVLAFFSSW